MKSRALEMFKACFTNRGWSDKALGQVDRLPVWGLS